MTIDWTNAHSAAALARGGVRPLDRAVLDACAAADGSETDRARIDDLIENIGADTDHELVERCARAYDAAVAAERRSRSNDHTAPHLAAPVDDLVAAGLHRVGTAHELEPDRVTADSLAFRRSLADLGARTSQADTAAHYLRRCFEMLEAFLAWYPSVRLELDRLGDTGPLDWEPNDLHRGGRPVCLTDRFVLHPRPLDAHHTLATVIDDCSLGDHLRVSRPEGEHMEGDHAWLLVDLADGTPLADHPILTPSASRGLGALATIAHLLGGTLEPDSILVTDRHVHVAHIDSLVAGSIIDPSADAGEWAAQVDLVTNGPRVDPQAFRDGVAAVVAQTERVEAAATRTASPTRVFVRPTTVYAQLLYGVVAGINAQHRAAGEYYATRLRASPISDAAGHALAVTEMTDILAGDIPYLMAHPDTTDLDAGQGGRVANALVRSGHTVASDRCGQADRLLD